MIEEYRTQLSKSVDPNGMADLTVNIALDCIA